MGREELGGLLNNRVVMRIVRMVFCLGFRHLIERNGNDARRSKGRIGPNFN